jgi:hypothetical protein
VLDLKYNFNWGAGDNGNVQGFTNDKDSNRSVYTYDALNRIASATTPNIDCSLVTGTHRAGREGPCRYASGVPVV